MTPVIDYLRWCREEPSVQSFIHDTIGNPSTRSAGLLGARTVRAVLDDCFNPRGSGATTFLVGRLLAYELWYHRFVDEEFTNAETAE